MKASLTLATALLGLAAALPQGDQIPQDLVTKLEATLKQVDVDNAKAEAGDAGTLDQISKQLAWQAAGNLYGPIGQGASIVSLLSDASYTISKENGKEWLKNLGGLALSFLPEVGTLGNLPGFISIMKTIATGLEAAQFPELAAKRAAAAKCFADNSQRTYKDVCQNCNADLSISLLARLNKCTDDNVVSRMAYQDNKFAQTFCGEVLCAGHQKGDVENIIKQHYRYDPVRAFWCKKKDELIGMVMSPWIGKPLLENYHMLDHEDLRQALTPACKELMASQQIKVEGECPTRAEFDEANKRSVPQSYCQPGSAITTNTDDNRPFNP